MNKHADIPAAEADAAAGAAPRRPRWLAQVLVAALLLVAGVLGYRGIMALAPEPKVRKAVERPLPVRVLAVRPTDVRPVWTLYGEVAAARRTTLQLPVSGRIVSVSPKWREGARVEKGEELLRIDDLACRATVAEAKAALAEATSRLEEATLKVSSEQRLLKDAEASFAVAERELQRTRRLAARGTLPKARLDQQQRTWLAAREKLEQRRHALAAARAALARQQAAKARAEWALKKAEDNLNNTVLRAPFGGQLAEVRAEVGQQAGPSAPLATLLSTAAPEVRFTMPEDRLAALTRAGEQATGRAVQVLLRQRGETVALPAHVVREAARVDRKQGAIALFARLDAPRKAAWLKPGMFVAVRMQGPLLKNVALLPEAALQDEHTVYAVRDGRLARFTVRILGMQGDKAIVAGLPAGLPVISHRLAAPKPGQAVKVLERG